MRQNITNEEFEELAEKLEEALPDTGWAVIPFNGVTEGEVEGLCLGAPDLLDEIQTYIEFFHENTEYMPDVERDVEKLNPEVVQTEEEKKYYYSKIFILQKDYEKFSKVLKKSKIKYILLPNIAIHEAIIDAEQNDTSSGNNSDFQ